MVEMNGTSPMNVKTQLDFQPHVDLHCKQRNLAQTQTGFGDVARKGMAGKEVEATSCWTPQMMCQLPLRSHTVNETKVYHRFVGWKKTRKDVRSYQK